MVSAVEGNCGRLLSVELRTARLVLRPVAVEDGFHSANAALALIMVTLGPIEHVLPHERTTAPDP
jgi:hypothetical protein